LIHRTNEERQLDSNRDLSFHHRAHKDARFENNDWPGWELLKHNASNQSLQITWTALRLLQRE
jgi:hypothetical protein